MQDADGEMIFDVAKLVSELSRGMKLLPGTVILTGTPSREEWSARRRCG